MTHTKDEALKLALEALEGLKSIPGGRHELHELNAIHRKHDRAIITIKQALAAPVQKRPPNCGTGYCSCVECVMEPAPVQEPVAWLYKGDAEFDGKEWRDNIRVTTSKQVADWQGKDIQPLYTTLPAAQPAVPDAFGTREGEHPEYIQGWNDCRAETLKMRKP
jgi:hypothetical protein